MMMNDKKKHEIKHRLKYEITKDAKMDFRYMQRDNARISKQAIIEKISLGKWKLRK